jgi:glutamine amidotransferase
MDMIGVNTIVSSNVSDISQADKIIMPGVGHFGNAMSNLKALNLLDALNEFVLVKKKPILGICLGMQLMASFSEEGNTSGLGWIDGNIVRFKVNDQLKHKIPHTGWNQISLAKPSALMSNIPDGAEFYFVHSYHFSTDDESVVLNRSEYDYSFVSAIAKNNIFGVQYHPEKSHDVGRQLLKNFVYL